ncbi:MAG: phosphoribosylamine--glycine ligase [Kiritimatiellia bacterium]|jgi:phosphoribosylamine--glycine ligase
MKILVIGNGGREHAIAWKLHADAPKAKIFCAPGNAGTAAIAKNIAIAANDAPAIVDWAQANKPDLVVVGPEAPLCLGLVDALEAVGIRAFGPCQAAAQLEGSKKFAKEVMEAAQVPTARYTVARTAEAAHQAVAEFGIPVVLKADGLAAGKGVSVCMTEADAEAAIQAMFLDQVFGSAAAEVLVEEFLLGEEASVLAFIDGETVVPLASSQDHKRLLDGDQGPNTGGMGAYSPAPCMTDDMLAVVQSQVFKPVVAELKARGIAYKGILYAGMMLTDNGPRVLEFNCRFGDPETQCVLPRLASPLADAMLACIDGNLASCDIRWSPDPCACVVMASGGYPGDYEKGKPIEGLAEAAKMPGVQIFHAGTALANGGVVTAGGRVLSVGATAPTLEKTLKRAYAAILKIKFENAQYRTDIANRALKRKE